jgi:hypothetical protein
MSKVVDIEELERTITTIYERNILESLKGNTKMRGEIFPTSFVDLNSQSKQNQIDAVYNTELKIIAMFENLCKKYNLL